MPKILQSELDANISNLWVTTGVDRLALAPALPRWSLFLADLSQLMHRTVLLSNDGNRENSNEY